MNTPTDHTHDAALDCWVESAADPATDFPVQNLPLCAFRVRGDESPRPGVRIGDELIDLARLSAILPAREHEAINAAPGLVGLMSLGPRAWTALRRRLVELLTARSGRDTLRHAMLPASDATLDVPLPVGDYTDFYASVHHATNVGSMFRPENPLLPNYKHLPIGYHGRASSIVVSGTPVRRPVGQQSPAEEGGRPGFGPSIMLDYELEIGAFIGVGNDLGTPIPLDQAEAHVLGLCLVNDWSARDIQRWEYQPLGPFLAKSFATTISPYVVTLDALAPFRTPAFERAAGDPTPLPYLDSDRSRAAGGIDLTCEVYLASAQMRSRGMPPVRLSRGSFRHMYWTIAQFVAHHTSNGCNLRPGDLLASGTISGPTRDSRGSLLELTWDGDPWATPPVVVPGTQRTPLTLPTGEQRRFLADGDEVILRAFCQRDGFRRIGLGECAGTILPARG